MAEELPPWLNTEFLETVLQEEDGRVKVVKFTAKLALPPGSNYTSHIYRVKVVFKKEELLEDESVSLMVKAPITKGVINEMQDKVDLFVKEPQVYSELLPKFKLKIPNDFAPKCYPCPTKGLVLKDLKDEGYVMCERLNQLEFSHCKLALTTLAKFHATSVACCHDDPEFIQLMGKEVIYTEEFLQGDVGSWFKSALETVSSMLREMENCQQGAEFILKRSSNIVTALINLCKPQEGSLNVLNHGDFWMNNMLFKHDDTEKVVDIRFIDFQVMRYASPALDILYFLYTSANDDARARQKELLDAYLHTLNSYLERFDCEERLSSEQLEEDMMRYVDWAIISICSVLPVVLCDPENVLNMEDFSEEDFHQPQVDDKYLKIYTSKGYITQLPKVMMHFQQQFIRDR